MIATWSVSGNRSVAQRANCKYRTRAIPVAIGVRARWTVALPTGPGHDCITDANAEDRSPPFLVVPDAHMKDPFGSRRASALEKLNDSFCRSSRFRGEGGNVGGGYANASISVLAALRSAVPKPSVKRA